MLRSPLVAASVLALCTLAAGCAGSSESEPASCAAEGGSPISVADVTTALRAHGITASPATRSASCGFGVVADVTNTHFYGPRKNIREHDAVRKREGLVTCSVRDTPEPGAPTTVEASEGDDETTFTIQNVECSVYTEKASGRAQVTRLQRAVNEIADAGK